MNNALCLRQINKILIIKMYFLFINLYMYIYLFDCVLKYFIHILLRGLYSYI